jgi:hypothetical protein
MKIISITRGARPSTLGVASEPFKLKTVNTESVTITVSNILATKDLLLTFSKQEVRALMTYFDEQEKSANDLAKTVQGTSDNTKPDSLV